MGKHVLPRIDKAEFLKFWNEAENNQEGLFCARNKDPKAYLGKNYEEDRFFIWNGSSCMYNDRMLIMGATLVYGVKDEPRFISPREFLKNFVFTDRNPRTGEVEPKGTLYRVALQEIKQHVAAIARRS